MESVVLPPSDTELHLLTDWSETGRRERTRAATIGSVFTHITIIAILVALPSYTPPPPEEQVHRTVTPLIEPLTELTQKAPNTAKVTKEFNAREMTPRPRIQSPPPGPPRPAPVTPPAAPKAVQPAPLPEPPKIEAKAAPPPKVELPQVQPPPAPPPPQIQAEEKPKTPFENIPSAPAGVAPGRSEVPIPGSGINDAVRQVLRNPDAQGGLGGGVTLPGSPNSRAVLPQLLSDPQGVDFRPYLTQILATVRRNWMAVMPESVRQGRRGQVAIQFSIARDGKVPKLVIAVSSGADPLDRAAVAGISASSPFPPLPGEFKGDRVVLQFNFSYNMPRQ